MYPFDESAASAASAVTSPAADGRAFRPISESVTVTGEPA
jgi:hypothetical protein